MNTLGDPPISCSAAVTGAKPSAFDCEPAWSRAGSVPTLRITTTCCVAVAACSVCPICWIWVGMAKNEEEPSSEIGSATTTWNPSPDGKGQDCEPTVIGPAVSKAA